MCTFLLSEMVVELSICSNLRLSLFGALGQDEAVKGEDLTSIARASRRQGLGHDREDEALVEEGFEGSQVDELRDLYIPYSELAVVK